MGEDRPAILFGHSDIRTEGHLYRPSLLLAVAHYSYPLKVLRVLRSGLASAYFQAIGAAAPLVLLRLQQTGRQADRPATRPTDLGHLVVTIQWAISLNSDHSVRGLLVSNTFHD